MTNVSIRRLAKRIFRIVDNRVLLAEHVIVQLHRQYLTPNDFANPNGDAALESITILVAARRPHWLDINDPGITTLSVPWQRVVTAVNVIWDARSNEVRREGIAFVKNYK
jgi:hypothetical protein